jgi:CheY-like chemotaxis protein
MTALSVLVVEDDAMISMLLAEMLIDMGYTVCAIAVSEDDAVADAVRHKPGLMIVDEHLREGSGMAAVGRILRDGPVPCVFIGGAPMLSGKPNRQVLQKPFLEADLIRAIGRVVAYDDLPLPYPPAGPYVVTGH